MKNHFRQIQAFKPDYASVDISQFESERTGMRVVLVQREGPIVEGRFMFATEIHDDSGAREFRCLVRCSMNNMDASTYSRALMFYGIKL